MAKNPSTVDYKPITQTAPAPQVVSSAPATKPEPGPPAGAGDLKVDIKQPPVEVGDFVHYVSIGGTLDFPGKHRAALVTDIDANGKLSLTVFPSDARVAYKLRLISYSAAAVKGSWHPKDMKHD